MDTIDIMGGIVYIPRDKEVALATIRKRATPHVRLLLPEYQHADCRFVGGGNRTWLQLWQIKTERTLKNEGNDFKGNLRN